LTPDKNLTEVKKPVPFQNIGCDLPAFKSSKRRKFKDSSLVAPVKNPGLKFK
jgi:hypothetical protein